MGYFGKITDLNSIFYERGHNPPERPPKPDQIEAIGARI